MKMTLMYEIPVRQIILDDGESDGYETEDYAYNVDIGFDDFLEYLEAKCATPNSGKSIQNVLSEYWEPLSEAIMEETEFEDWLKEKYKDDAYEELAESEDE